MSRSLSPGKFFCAGDEFSESESEFLSKTDRARWTALGLDEELGDPDESGEGSAPRCPPPKRRGLRPPRRFFENVKCNVFSQ